MNSFNPQPYIQMGYTQQQVKQAYNLSLSKGIDIFDAFQSLQYQSDSPKKNAPPNKSQTFLTPIETIKIRQYQTVYSRFADRNQEILKADIRQPNNPVGLLNVANCCYLNSLLQCYFLLGDFVQEILTAEPLDRLQQVSQSKIKVKRIQNEYALLKKWQYQSKKYLDPQPILKRLMDSAGHLISYGEEKDLFQINIQFIQRLNQCLLHTKKYYRNQQNKPIQNSAIKKLFYGTKVQILQQTQVITDFLGIIVNPIHRNILRAMDEQLHYEVQIQGKKIRTIIFIHLYYSLGYDRQKQFAKKNEQTLTYDFSIYLDRYLERYKEIDMVNSPAIQNLLSKKDNIISKINHLDIISIKLSQCLQHTVFLDGWTEKFPKKQEINEAKNILKAQLNIIQKQLQKIQSRKQKYQLIYIFVHRGDASSGHYWGYGRNKDVWIRFDINSKILHQQQLFSQIQKAGGTTYALVYAKQNKIPNIPYQYHLEGLTNHKYLQFIPKKIQNQIIQENKQVEKNYQKKQQTNLIQTKDYQKSKLKIFFYDNFTLYLYSRKLFDLSKYHIFELSLKTISNMKVEDLLSKPLLLKKIQKTFSKRAKGENTLRHFILSKQPNQFSRFNQIYRDYIKQKLLIKKIFEIRSVINQQNNYKSLLQQLQTINKLSKDQTYIEYIIQQIYTLIVLRICKQRKINRKYVEKYKLQPLILQQIKQLSGIQENFSEDILSLSQQKQQKKQQQLIVSKQDRNYTWKIQQLKNRQNSVTEGVNKVLNQILQSMGQQLAIYKQLTKNKIITKRQKIIKYVIEEQPEQKKQEEVKKIQSQSLI